jgi:hypothetical protein
MPTVIVRPNGNNNDLWTEYDYGKISDPVVQPNAGDGIYIYARKADADERQQYDMETLAVTAVTNVTVWIYGRYLSGSNRTIIFASISMGGYWQDPVQVQLSDTFAWYSVSFSPPVGGWGQSDMDTLIAGLTAPHNDSIYDEQDVDVLYCSITYTPPPPGEYGDFFAVL